MMFGAEADHVVIIQVWNSLTNILLIRIMEWFKAYIRVCTALFTKPILSLIY